MAEQAGKIEWDRMGRRWWIEIAIKLAVFIGILSGWADLLWGIMWGRICPYSQKPRFFAISGMKLAPRVGFEPTTK